MGVLRMRRSDCRSLDIVARTVLLLLLLMPVLLPLPCILLLLLLILDVQMLVTCQLQCARIGLGFEGETTRDTVLVQEAHAIRIHDPGACAGTTWHPRCRHFSLGGPVVMSQRGRGPRPVVMTTSRSLHGRKRGKFQQLDSS